MLYTQALKSLRAPWGLLSMVPLIVRQPKMNIVSRLLSSLTFPRLTQCCRWRIKSST